METKKCHKCCEKKLCKCKKKVNELNILIEELFDIILPPSGPISNVTVAFSVRTSMLET